MSAPVLILVGEPGTPTIRALASEVYSLYHWLVREGTGSDGDLSADIRAAARKAARARHLRGVHGIWDEWEVPLAAGGTVEEAIAALKASMTATVEALEAALHEARAYFHDHIWPSHLAAINAAMATLREAIEPQFPALLRRHSDVLDLRWPADVSAYLVAECYAWQGGYSHPLTIDVSVNTGTTLYETFIHEVTHVADADGEAGMGSRLIDRLLAEGIAPQDAWNAWHGIIFASSADQVRRFIDPSHVDYASTRGLYSRLGVPDLPDVWASYSDGAITENDLFAEVAGRLASYITSQ